MATYPPHLSSNWDGTLKTYIDQYTPTNGGRAVGKGELFINAADYNPVGNGTTDDTAALQEAFNAAAGGRLILPYGKTFKVNSTITIPAGTYLSGAAATLKTDQNIKIFTLGGDGITIEDLTLQGSLPTGNQGDAAFANQMGIYYNGTASTPIRTLRVRNCIFLNFHAVGVQIIHGRGIRVDHCRFDQYASCGVWYQSVIGGRASHNSFNGTGQLYLGTNFCYAVTATVSIVNGIIDDTVNPRSRKILISNNEVTNQAWECLDTHLGDQITFANNICESPGAGITAVGNDNAPSLSPTNIVATGNIITCDPNVASTGGIALVGSKDYTNASRERLTGAITGNVLNGCYTDGQTASGAINVSNSRGVTVSGNSLTACKSVAIFLRNAASSVVQGNTITDVWRTDTGAAGFYIIRDNDDFTVSMTSNVMSRGTLAKPNVNAVAIGGTSHAGITLQLTSNQLTGTVNSTMTRVISSPPLRSVLAADQTVNNSVALAATAISLSVDANTVYELNGFLAYNTSQAADAQVGWTVPSGASMQWTLDSLFTNVTSGAGTVYRSLLTAAQPAIAGGPGSANAVARPIGTVTTGSTAGLVTLTFAQNTADPTDSKLFAGSWIRLTKVA